MKKLHFIIIIFLCLFTQQIFAADESTPLRVGVMFDEDPVSYVTPSGEYRGIGVDIWKEIAIRNNLNYKFIKIKGSILDVVEDAKISKYDVIIGPIAVTNQRLQQVDFSRPFFLSRIGIAVPNEKESFWNILGNFFTKPVLALVVIFFILFVIFTHLFWYYERGKSEQVAKEYNPGIWQSMWYTGIFFLRDVIHDPPSLGGRIVSALWVICALVFITAFTAIVTSTLTLTLFTHQSSLHNPRDLYGKTVAVEAGSEEEVLVKKYGAKVISVKSPVDAVHDLAAGEYDAVVGPYEVLSNVIQHTPSANVHMTSLILSHESFAYVIPTLSKLRQKVDFALTKLQDERWTHDVCSRYAVHFTHSCEF